MLFYTGLLFLVIAVSLDGFGVGITYGMRNIRVPFFALIIIMMISGITVLASMTIGSLLSSFISPGAARIFGGCILICLGLFSLFNIIRSKSDTKEVSGKQSKRFRVFKKVIRTPDQADIDSSGIISANEASLLGIALALDAFGAGLGAAIIGYDPLITALLIAIMSGFFVFSGIKLGIVLAKNEKIKHMTFVAPILLIALGIFNMFK